jgi:hypothetical protein
MAAADRTRANEHPDLLLPRPQWAARAITCTVRQGIRRLPPRPASDAAALAASPTVMRAHEMDIRGSDADSRAKSTPRLCAVLIALLIVAPMAAALAADLPPATPELSTPQIVDALRPLDGVPGRLRVHAAVATLPDPLETRQGRSFDMTLAAGIAGFQAHGYVLDGYVLQWPRASRAVNDGSDSGV